MAKCAACGSTIVIGGVKDGADTYCNRQCLGAAQIRALERAIPPDVIDATTRAMFEGPCPRCGGAGPVDVHLSHFVFSVVVMTSRTSTPHVCCRSCARKSQALSAAGSAVVGWWGIPWGLIFTPVQIGRNISAMRAGERTEPSAELRRFAVAQIGAQLAARQASGQTA